MPAGCTNTSTFKYFVSSPKTIISTVSPRVTITTIWLNHSQWQITVPNLTSFQKTLIEFQPESWHYNRNITEQGHCVGHISRFFNFFHSFFLFSVNLRKQDLFESDEGMMAVQYYSLPYTTLRLLHRRPGHPAVYCFFGITRQLVTMVAKYWSGMTTFCLFASRFHHFLFSPS